MISYQSNKKDVGTKGQLLIYQVTPRDCRKRHTNLEMPQVVYKKAYMVPRSYILGVLELLQVSDKHPSIDKQINDKLVNRVELMQRRPADS